MSATARWFAKLAAPRSSLLASRSTPRSAPPRARTLARLLGIILPVFAIVLLGYFYARRVRPDMTAVNHLSVNVLAPALAFSALASKDFDLAANRSLMLGSIVVVLGSGLLAWPFARLMNTSARTFVPPTMFNNCGNMGLPLAALAYGAGGFSPMVALFTISNLLLFTLGVLLIDHRAKFGSLARNPIVVATIAGFAFAVLHPSLPEWLTVAIKLVSDALIPMMLLSLGVRLSQVTFDDWQIGVMGGLIRPLTGIAIATLVSSLLDLDPVQQGLLILFGSLPPAVLSFVIAEQFKQEPGKVASIVLIGHLLAMAFVPLGLTIALNR